eukprot:scaffold1677_cov247-Prasinococcus_capsulatus_cf.AAC.1
MALGKKGGDDLAKLSEQEVIHGRFAMMAVTGMVAPEFSASLFENADDAVWYNVGKTILSGPIDFVGDSSLVHASNLYAVIAVQFVAMQLSEYYRAKGGPLGEAAGAYPGGAFDPMGFADDEEAFAELKVKEVKNGRLAMLAVAGCYAQSFVSSQGPVADVFAHAADPTHYVLFGSALHRCAPASRGVECASQRRRAALRCAALLCRRARARACLVCFCTKANRSTQPCSRACSSSTLAEGGGEARRRAWTVRPPLPRSLSRGGLFTPVNRTMSEWRDARAPPEEAAPLLVHAHGHHQQQQQHRERMDDRLAARRPERAECRCTCSRLQAGPRVEMR